MARNAHLTCRGPCATLVGMSFSERLKAVCEARGWKCSLEGGHDHKITVKARHVARVTHLEDGSTWVWGRHKDAREAVGVALFAEGLMGDD